MTATNPVHPDLRRDVQRAMSLDADVSIRPTRNSRDGVIQYSGGILHTHLMEDYEIAGIGLRYDDYTLVHVQRTDN